MALEVGIIADDLTGALDVAAPFAERGLRTLVVLSPEQFDVCDAAALKAAEVICINTASREIVKSEARRRVDAAAASLMPLGPAIVFKKIDSRLKGHVVAETEAMLDATGRIRALVAPAIPDMGRLVVDGMVTGMGVAEPIDVLERFGSLPVSAPDTPDSAAMDLAGSEVMALNGTVLAVGARGLAQSLALRQPERPAPCYAGPLPRPALIAIGSRDPITRRQIERLLRSRHIAAPNGQVPPFEAYQGLTLVTVEESGVEEAAAAVAARFAKGITDAVRGSRPASMLISGGETAQAILTQLGVGVLELGGEALPGVPFATALIEGQHVVILTKSGGFGTPDTISLLAGEPLELN